MFKKLSKFGIGTKILLIILLVSMVAQLATGILSYISIIRLANYSKEEAASLGIYASGSSEYALKNQAESYLKEVSGSLADVSDSVLEEVSDQVLSYCDGLEDIYKYNRNSGGTIPPLPETTTEGSDSNRDSASEKAYAVDSQNTSYEKDVVLAHSLDEYPNEYLNEIYKTDITSWMKLTDKERETIQKSKVVVSNNRMPQNIREELKLVSNSVDIAKPLYVGNVAISSIYLGTESGISYRYSPYIPSARYDPRLRPWYIDAVNAKKKKKNIPVWQSSYLSISGGTLCITCSKAFCDKDGKILGVAAIDMHLENVNKYIINAKLGESGFAFVVDNSGKIIMHPDYKSGENENFNTEPLNDSTIDDTYHNLILNMMSGKSGVEVARINGKEYYAAYSPMVTSNWSLGTTAEVEEIIKPAVDAKTVITDSAEETRAHINNDLIGVSIQFFIVFVICLVLVYIIGVRMAKDVVKPLEKLKSEAARIGSGDFSIKIHVESNDEIGQLAGSFNKMAGDLQQYVKELAHTTAEKQKIQSELTIAKQIQSSMLPRIFPAFPDRKDFDIYALMDPAKEIGGDFYDFFFVDNNNLALVMSDVSGKGISAALIMVIAKTLIKNQMQAGSSPAEAFEIVNNQLFENNDAGMFVTSFAGVINLRTGKFTYANAGHNPPLIYKDETDKYEWLKKPRGFVLGGMKNMKYTDSVLSIAKGDLLYLYTDGVTEAMNPANELFSEERLENILNDPNTKKLNLKELITSLRKDIDIFADGAERADDITMLAFRSFDIPPEN